MSLWAAWLQGKVAMIYSWPPTGRMSAGYSQSDKAISFIPQSSIAGKVGYAIVPGGHPEHAFGFNKALAADSANPEAAYLFMQWACSPPGVAGALHAALRAARPVPDLALQVGALRRTLPERAGISEEPQQLRQCRACSTRSCRARRTTSCRSTACARRCGPGTDPMEALKTAAAEWDMTTENLGVESQKAFYEEFLKLPGADRRQHGGSAGHGGEALAAATRTAGRLPVRRSARAVPPPAPSGGTARPILSKKACATWPTASQSATIASRLRAGGFRRRAAATGASSGCWSRPAALLILAISIYPLLFSIWVAVRQLRLPDSRPRLRRPEELRAGHLRSGRRATRSWSPSC